jgi:hypothetical protein
MARPPQKKEPLKDYSIYYNPKINPFFADIKKLDCVFSYPKYQPKLQLLLLKKIR